MKPNVIYILVDDLGAGDFSAFNGGISQTPRLDALMGEGVCLEQHYAASPVCNPSRAALLTGRYPHRTGSIDTLEGRGLDRLARREVTLADAFHRAGYATGHVGKWHLGAFAPEYHPNRRGFDEFTGFRGGWSDYYRWRLERNGRPMPADGRYLTDVFTQSAVDFIERHRAQPFFLHLCYNAPHTPPQAPLDEIRPFVEAGRVSFPVAVMYGMIRRLDRGVEQVLDTLRRMGLEENTVVVFSSDNGPQFVSELGPIPRFNCHFNGRKGTTYEGGVRVPAIVRWPAGGLTGGRRENAFLHMVDWYPTLLSLAGLPAWAPNALDGIDQSRMLRGESGTVNPKRFWQWNRYRPTVFSNAAMRDGDWKLVRPEFHPVHQVLPEDVRRDQAMRYEPEAVTDILTDPLPCVEVTAPPPLELYDLRVDPQERHNRAADQPDRVRRMSDELEAWFESVERDRRATGEARE